MDAKITIDFVATNLCSEETLTEDGWTFDEMVRFLIKEEGLFGIVEDEFCIVNIVQLKTDANVKEVSNE